MGISLLCAQMILHEHRYRPIKGRLITIARHSIDLTGDEMDRLLRAMGIPKRSGATYQIDQETVSQPTARGTITQESFFGAFTDASILSLDVSTYEKAEVVCDLQGRLPWRYRHYADFVFDGGSLDNIFDPAAAFRNISRMLKPGGRFLAMNTGGPNAAAYLKFSPDWFMDFCAINRYADCKTYIAHYPNTVDVTLNEQRNGNNFSRSPHHIVVYAFNPYVENAGGAGYDCSMIDVSSRYQVYCVAEKGAGSSDHLNPIQKHYRVEADARAISNESAKRFLDAPRPLFANEAEFDPTTAPRIDTSDYPQMLQPIAVINDTLVDAIRFGGLPAW